MTAKDDAVYCHTEAMVSKKRRKHYRIPVRSQHWQLRSLISAEKRHLIYFPGGNGSNHVQRLNTSTQECETIKLLTFAPRCLVAENGWLCCGSESGDFVAIRLDEDSDTSNPNTPLNLDPDARLPLNLESSREESLLALITQARRTNKSLIAKSAKLAEDRVNCITMWFPNALAPVVEGAYAEPVAVLANNDCTVTIISLRDFDRNDKITPLEVVTYPDFVNRATISPNGRIMVAILDDPYLYVHVRVRRWESGRPQEYQWEHRQRLMLKSQKKGDRTDSRGSFAACFSNSGSYLAVGTQHGTISIFDVNLLLDVDAQPLITTFESSRPRSGPGAIRDMAFCPGPFDILAWTEDRGHIGIADVRANFVVRQIVDINADADFEHISIFDRNTIDPRLLDGQNAIRRDTTQPSARGGSASTRRDGEARIDTLNQPLTSQETMVLEALQGDRRRRDRIAQRSESSDTTMTDDFPYAASLRPLNMESEPARPRQQSSSVTRGTLEQLGLLRDQRERERERLTDRARNIRQPGREQGDRLSARRDQGWIDRLGETVAALREQRERGSGERPDGHDVAYLNVLDILQARERSTSLGAGAATGAASGARAVAAAINSAANDPARGDSSLLVPLVNQVVNRWEESAIRGTLVTEHAGVFEVPPSPDNTAGLAWSDDGRTLFVGAQNGIYEFQINARNRLFYPSLQMR